MHHGNDGEISVQITDMSTGPAHGEVAMPVLFGVLLVARVDLAPYGDTSAALDWYAGAAEYSHEADFQPMQECRSHLQSPNLWAQAVHEVSEYVHVQHSVFYYPSS